MGFQALRDEHNQMLQHRFRFHVGSQYFTGQPQLAITTATDEIIAAASLLANAVFANAMAFDISVDPQKGVKTTEQVAAEIEAETGINAINWLDQESRECVLLVATAH